ncbi:hypothetical protein Tco_0123332, partial [Tanacetum coccineum]
GRINAIDANDDITLVNVYDVNVSAVSAVGDKVSTADAATTVSVATTTTATTVEEITLAQALADLKSTKPKAKGIVFRELGESTTTTTPIPSKIQDKAKEEKIDEANIAWDEIQEKVDADYQKHFAAKRAEEKRNKPPTKSQQKKTMITYLKNMEGWKHKDLKSKDFDSIKELFDKAFKRQKVDEDKDTSELQSLIEITPDEKEVTIDAIPLAVKSPSIVGWKIHKEGRKSYYQIMRADGKSQMYMIFSHMLRSFSREDLKDLYKLVKTKYKLTRPVEDLDLLLWGDLKTIFEPHVEDIVWRNQQDYKVLDWKLYDSCGVHSLRMQHVHIHMLVEKKYPLIPSTLSMMLEKKLQIDYESEMAYQLLKFIVKQLKK